MGYLNAGGTAGLLIIQNFPVPDKQKCYLGLIRACKQRAAIPANLCAFCMLAYGEGTKISGTIVATATMK